MGTKRLNIGVLAGYWSTNIGNSFFQLGAQWVLRQALPGHNIFLIGDQSGYYNVRRGNPPHALDYVAHLNVDAVVLLGPFLRPEVTRIIGPMLQALHDKGTTIIALATGMMQYDRTTIERARTVLRNTPPLVMTTRDRPTYEALGDLATYAYDGIDVATFVSDVFPAVPSDLPAYVVLNFDQIPEPTFTAGRAAGVPFEWDGQPWTVAQPRLRTELSYRSRVYPFVEAFLPLTRRPERIGPYLAVRTDHRYNPFLPRRSYRWPNSYAGDVPFTYLNLYAHTQCTFSNRVHACVATAAYGNPAMLFTRSPRAYLLDRLGLSDMRRRPTRVDAPWLRSEKHNLIEWLRQALSCMCQ